MRFNEPAPSTGRLKCQRRSPGNTSSPTGQGRNGLPPSAAMSFSLAGTKTSGIVFKDAECVNKTYPNYFEDLEKLSAARA